ncbi:MAG TPA: 16S rRNA (guanine(527)-N(7))-methyltransferase RsmG [Candidatus Edwardsbacteria bacterium]|nr:16S rRNA (guanine(527)-N(7))-methyltransferase RsmG [Candidatus Edwardsbacteria bacterium]
MQTAAEGSGLSLDPAQAASLSRFCDLLRDWNGRINLVSRKDIGNLVPNHVVDSLAALPLLQQLMLSRHSEPVSAPDHRRIYAGEKDRSFEGKAGCATQDDGKSMGLRVMDLGSGGGFPGIPLKICLPGMRITFVEATQKKAKFIELAVAELGLAETAVIARHSSELARDPGHRAQYDVVATRAVAELKELVKLSFPFLKPGGRLLAYKASKADEEIAAAHDVVKKSRGVIEPAPALPAPPTEKTRRIVVVRKLPAAR